jgi:hypothetical protein
VAAAFRWHGAYGFDIWDEGLLWYGVQQTLSGDVPMRDFMAYRWAFLTRFPILAKKEHRKVIIFALGQEPSPRFGRGTRSTPTAARGAPT